MFPSPYGDFVFQPFTTKHISVPLEQFPSPYGDFVFQLVHPLVATITFHIEFPSPYGDFVFQHAKQDKRDKVSVGSFRPLTGILFFNG